MQKLTELSPESAKIEELLEFAKAGQIARVETIWIELVEGGEFAAESLGPLLDAIPHIVRRGDKSRAAVLLELLHPAVVGQRTQPTEPLIRLYEHLVRFFPGRREFRQVFCECFEGFYGPMTPERAFYSVSRVADAPDPVAALDRFRRLERFKVGSCVYHASGWGVGEVVAVDALLKQVKVNLEHKKDHRIAMDAVDSILEPLADESFRALAHRDAAGLARLAAAEPVFAVEKVLDAFGNPQPLKDIKARLVPIVINAADWTRWWTRAKVLLRESGFYRVGDRAPYHVEKLQAALSYEDDVIQSFAKASWPQARQIARQVLRAPAEEFPRARVEIIDRLLRVAEGETDEAAVGEAVCLLVKHVGGERVGGIVANLPQLLSMEKLVLALESVPSGDDPRFVLEAFRDADPQGWPAFSRRLFAARSEVLRRAVTDVIEAEDPARARKLAEEVYTTPRIAPETFCWLLELFLEGERRPVLEQLDGKSYRDLLVMLLDLTESVLSWESRRGRSALKDIMRRVEVLFVARDDVFFEQAVVEMLPDERIVAHGLLVRCAEHMPRVSLQLIEILRRIEPSISLEESGPAWDDDNVIYTTEAGVARKTSELRELTDVKLPRIFEAIGVAAGFGDLSENAEFTSALEERDHLTKRATRIEDELRKARIILAEDLRPGVVGLGSRIRILDLDSHEEKEFTILGPWDGGVEEGILNYRSPLGMGFLGRADGEEVEIELPVGKRRYRLVSSSPGNRGLGSAAVPSDDALSSA